MDPFELAGKIITSFEETSIIFQNMELPAPEERSRPLIITVDIDNCSLPGVLIDTGASRSLCSLSTLNFLGIEENKITKCRFACTAYDKSKKEAIGTIQMDVTIGPLTSATLVVVMEEDLAEPLILGRSWLAEIGTVPSPVHQSLKFRHQGEVIIVRADHRQCSGAERKPAPPESGPSSRNGCPVG